MSDSKVSINVNLKTRGELTGFILMNWDGAEHLGKMEHTFFSDRTMEYLRGFANELIKEKEIIHFRSELIIQ